MCVLSPLQDVVDHLQKGVLNEECTVVVRRSNVLADALDRMCRKKFPPSKEITVIFICNAVLLSRSTTLFVNTGISLFSD